MTRELRVAVVGFGWMGQAHARAYARLLHHYPDAPLRPRLVAVADTADDDRLARAAGAYGFERTYRDWQTLLDREDVDVVSVTGPNHLHAEVGTAAAAAGKHLWIEKPVGRSAQETRTVAAAADAAGVQSAVGFNYRNAPAVERAKELVDSGRLGVVTHVDVRFVSDYAAHPQGALTWRFQNAFAGSGVLGDLASHASDLARFVVGDIVELVADDARFITQRPPAVGASSHFARGSDGPLAEVENEDYVGALLRFASGARGTLSASRASVGEQCTYGIEVHGTEGAVAWDFRRMGELRVCVDQDPQDASYTTWFVRPGDGELGAFQPGTGIAMGYDDLKVIEAERLVRSIAAGKHLGATLHDAVVAAETVEAMRTSLTERRWVTL